jgi:hypothetical protein
MLIIINIMVICNMVPRISVLMFKINLTSLYRRPSYLVLCCSVDGAGRGGGMLLVSQLVEALRYKPKESLRIFTNLILPAAVMSLM